MFCIYLSVIVVNIFARCRGSFEKESELFARTLRHKLLENNYEYESETTPRIVLSTRNVATTRRHFETGTRLAEADSSSAVRSRDLLYYVDEQRLTTEILTYRGEYRRRGSAAGALVGDGSGVALVWAGGQPGGQVGGQVGLPAARAQYMTRREELLPHEEELSPVDGRLLENPYVKDIQA